MASTLEGKNKKRISSASCLTPGLVSLTTPLRDYELLKLSEEISPNDWRKLCFRLGINEHELARAERENQLHLVDGVFKTLVRWREGQLENEERKVLVEALISCGLRRLEDRLSKGFQSSVRLSEGVFFPILDVEQCRRELMTNYRTSLCMIQLVPWDPNSHVNMNTIFTNVSLVSEDTSTATKQRVRLPGSYNDILNVTVNNASPLRILVEGKAGSGKTTLMSKLAYDWMEGAKDSPLRDVPLLFCLQLRFLDQNQDFGKAVVECILPEDTQITAEQLEEYAKVNPDKMVIVLDGYDEFISDVHGIKGTGNILRILENKRLTRCRVIVTSRPWKAADFKDQDLAKHYAHMTVEGFSESSTNTFIRKYFQNDLELSNHLLSYLSENTALQTVTQFPLFCAMLCQVWQDADKAHREQMRGIVTLSKLFDHIFTYLLAHYTKKQLSSRRERGTIKRFTLGRRSQGAARPVSQMNMHDCLKHLGRIALEGLISPDKKLQFADEDFRKYQDALHFGTSVGILIRQKSRPATSRVVKRHNSTTADSIIFFHKLAQEKCAGIYLSSMCTKQPKKFVQALKDVYILTRADEFRYVLQFACGEDLYTAKKILRHMPNITPYQKLALECNFESQSHIKSNKRLSKFFLMQRLFMNGRPSAYSFNALEYFLNNSEILRPADLPIMFNYMATDGIGPAQLGKLISAMNRPQFEFMIQLNIEHSRIIGADVKAFIESLSQKSYLGVLEMSTCKANRQFVNSLAELPHGGLGAMMMMYLPVLNTKLAGQLLRTLPDVCPRIAALEASFTHDDDEEPGIAEQDQDTVGMESNLDQTLKEINTSLKQNGTEIGLAEKKGVTTPDVPAPASTPCCAFPELVTLSLKGCMLCEEGSSQLATTLSLADKLEKLHLTKPSLHEVFHSKLASLDCLREFSIVDYVFGNFNLEGFLEKCPILEDLYVAGVENGNHDVNGVVQSLTKAIVHTPALRSITLWFPGTEHSQADQVQEDVFADLGEAILSCSHLSKLLLWHVPLGHDIVVKLLEICKRHRNLTTIRLSRCYTTTSDVLEQHFRDLTEAGRRIYIAHGC